MFLGLWGFFYIHVIYFKEASGRFFFNFLLKVAYTNIFDIPTHENGFESFKLCKTYFLKSNKNISDKYLFEISKLQKILKKWHSGTGKFLKVFLYLSFWYALKFMNSRCMSDPNFMALALTVPKTHG